MSVMTTVAAPLSQALNDLDRSDLVVFAGPSLVGSPLMEQAAHLLLPPVRDGDLIGACADRPPTAMLVVDGYFGAGQAVTLTEVRQVLDRGVRLYGCSSMGALRAVEARPWGMIGLGRVFTDYLTGVRTADENVVLLHDDGYRGLTAPTVNVDRLCALLEAEGVEAARCRAFGRRAAEMYFGDRSYAALRRLAADCFDAGSGAASGALQRVLDHLEPDRRPRWDVKRQDAEAALEAVATGRAPTRPGAEPVPVPDVPDLLLGKGPTD